MKTHLTVMTKSTNIKPSSLVFTILLLFIGFVSPRAFGQTAPTPQALPFTQDFSALIHSSTTYPAGIQGWNLATSPGATFRTTAPTANQTLTASSTAATTSGGTHNYNGSMGSLATGSVDPSIGIGINTTGLSNIQVNFDIMTIRNPYNGTTNTRINAVDLQYNVGGITGTWTTVTGLTDGIYQNNTTTQTTGTTGQNIQAISLNLPSACDNQSAVYIRLVQRQISGSGARPSFAIDNINITGSTPGPEITLSTNALADFGSVQVSTNSSEQSYTVSGSDLTDTLHIVAPAPFEISFTSGSGFDDTLFLIPVSGTVGTTTIYARFAPTSSGAVSDSIVHSSSGASTKKVGVSGTGSSCTSPNITPGGPTTFCTGGSVVLTADPGVSYLWSTSETTQSITVTSSGSYSVTVTDGSNCSATSAPTVVTVNNFGFSGILFSENMGTPASTTLVNDHTGFQNYGILGFSSTTTNQSDVRTTTASNYSGASGGGNVFMGTAGSNPRDFIISGINSSGYSGLTLSFGMHRTSTADNLIVSTSTDGINYTPLSTSAQPAINTWAVVNVSSGIPSASSLWIKFEKSTSNSFRIDDVILSGSVSTVDISALGSTTICQGTYVTLISNVPLGNQWDPVFAFTQAIQASVAGSYSTVVTDMNGCTAASDTITVTVIDAPVVGTSVTDALCFGDTSGTATALPTGGSPGYTYLWNTVPPQDSVTAINLAAGSYDVIVTDANGCTGTATAIVGEATLLQVSTSTTVPSTIGGSDGTATAFAFDGTPGYTYSWNTIPVQNSDVATGLMAGTYVVTVTDANGCTATASAVVVDPIPEITVSTTALGDFGTVIVGNSSYEDTYTVSGLYLTDPILINAPAGFEISETSGSGFSGSISLTPSSGEVFPTTIFVRFTPIAAGPASGNITHASTGATQKDVAVSGTGIDCPPATITAGGPTTFCEGGSVTLTASAGNTYLWSTSETTQSIVVSTSGSYTVVVTDVNNCSSTSPAEIVTVNSFSISGALFSENMGTPGGNTLVNNYSGWQNYGSYSYSSTTTNQSDVRTSTQSTGYAGASGSGNVFMGTAGGTNPRDFIIGGINTTGYTGLSLSFGMHRNATSELLAVSVSTDGINYTPITTTVQPNTNSWALVSDSIGSIPATSNLRIKFEKASSVNFRIDDITLSGTVDTLIVTPSGPLTICSGQTLYFTSNIGTGNLWSPGLETTQALAVTGSGSYFNTITDFNGCTMNSDTFDVFVNPSPAIDTIIGTNLICNNDSSGTATATISGGTGPYTYSWNSVPPQNSLGATGLKAGFYTFTVTDDNSCTASGGILITQPPVLNVTVSVISHPSFIGASDGSIASSASGGIPPYSFSWNSVPVQTDDTASNLMAGIYTVTVTDSNGCSVSATDTLNDPLPEIFVSTTTIPDFGNVVVGNSSAEATYTVSGINLSDSILITAPADFEISLTSGSGFGSSITLYPVSGVVGSTLVYVRFTPSSAGFVSADITHTSTGAVQKDVTVSGTGTTCPQATITPSGPLSFCAGGSVTLTASSGDTYLWSDGQTTASILVDTAGTFTVTVTDAFSCSSTSASVTITVNEFAYTGIIFSENIGNSGGTVALNPYTGWQNYGVLNFSTNPVGPSDVRTSTGSTGYTGASSGSNVFMGTAGGINPRDFIISGINTSGYTGLSLSFGMHRTSTAEALAVAVSTDGTNYTALSTSSQPNANTWALITATGAIPAASNVYIKFSKTSNVSFRIDDISLSGTVDTVIISGPSAFCQGSQITLSSNIPGGNLWSPGSETTKSITITNSGAYTVVATDGNGCTASSAPFTVTENPLPVISTSTEDISCNGAGDGEAIASAGGATAPYDYSWNTTPVQNNDTATGLDAGTYTVTVTDFLGCVDSASVSINEPAVLDLTCFSTDISCSGAGDGEVSVNVTGGTGTYDYSWNKLSYHTVVLQAAKDNSIYEANTSNSNGAGEYLVSGQTGSGTNTRALLAFDLSSIPSGAIITNAELALNMSLTSGSAGPQAFDLHVLLEDWGEGNSDAGIAAGIGAPAEPNADATWTDNFFALSSWTSLGSTFDAPVRASTTVDAVGPYVWVSPDLTTDVQNWVDNTLPNFGWLLKGQETAPFQAKRFDSRQNINPANRPALTVTYTLLSPLGNTQTITNLDSGTYVVTVTDANGCTATCIVPVNEPAPIVISGFVPNNGPVGTIVTISGSGFAPASDVLFNGTSASFTIDSDTQITATVPAGATTGPITVDVLGCLELSTGDFTVTGGAIDLNLTLFLEGYYLGGGTMWSTLYDLDQGFVFPSSPIGYPATATDSIEVNLWDPANLSNPGPDYSEKVILHNDGSATASFATAPAGSYWIAVKHRNHVETWSSATQSLVGGPNSYNFSTSLTQAYDDGFNPPMASLDAGTVFGFYGGDVNQDGTVDATDMADVDNDNNIFAFGYNVTDCTGDGATDASDIAIVDNNQNLFLFYARPY